MYINDAQKDMRQAYLGGSAGMFVSGLVWLISGFIGYFVSVQASVAVLFFGGMLIHPLGVAISKQMKRSGTHDKSNPLSALAIESTVLLFIGLFIAFVVVQIEANFFFPIMLLTIGGRYIIFATLYGLRIYWVVGGILAVAGMAYMMLSVPFSLGAFTGGIIELLFSWLVMKQAEAQDF